jgi:hypothetical protein
MFVITCRLRKFSGDRRLSDSDMPPAKAQRRQVRKKQIAVLKRAHLLLSDLCALARDNQVFGCGCSPTGEPLFPSAVWEKACTTTLEDFPGSRKFFRSKVSGYSSRQDRQGRQDSEFIFSFLCDLCVLCAKNFFVSFVRFVVSYFSQIWLRRSRAGTFVTFVVTTRVRFTSST